MLWVRNGYVELTIILNHKNIQHMFTLPFLHTLPIIITNEKNIIFWFSHFWWIGMSYWLNSPNYKKRREVCSWQCLVPFTNVTISNTKRNLIMSWISDISGPRFASLSYMCTCTQCDTQWGSASGQGGSICNCCLTAGQGLWKGAWLRLGQWPEWARGWLQGVRKAQWFWPGAFLHCCVALEMSGDWWKEQGRSSHTQGLMLKASGRLGLGWLCIGKREQPTTDRAWR